MYRFNEILAAEPDGAIAVAAIRALTLVIEMSKATTMFELQLELKAAIENLQKHSSSLSVVSGCELFTRFVTRTSLEIREFADCKERLIQRGNQFAKMTATSRDRICQVALPFISYEARILVIGFSRVVLAILKQAVAKQRRFSVVVAESRPEVNGYQMANRLAALGIPVKVIMDTAVAHYMDRIDVVLVGAAAVVENGGIISKIGTYQMAIVANAFSKPFYVAAESFKFTRVFPLNQRDLPPLCAEQKSYHVPDDMKPLHEAIVVCW
eukprot:CAMPEP_0174243954 /NCGR_PEP_ID=MMETSP0417-20130205/33499_1 /TAXON_ID=242541 /ORGANISM="Mayorella sp, Strain BSH-02190019" /LENGTH=267 /DNA_ID=CAMNT_0015323565 /DNA_START=55 /DNA_END=855 /DNA_ORIENTATION=+